MGAQPIGPIRPPVPLDKLALVVWVGAAILAVVFLVALLVRLWGYRMQRGGGASRGLDLEDLRRRRDSGELSREEFDAIAGRVAGREAEDARAERRRDAPRDVQSTGGDESESGGGAAAEPMKEGEGPSAPGGDQPEPPRSDEGPPEQDRPDEAAPDEGEPPQEGEGGPAGERPRGSRPDGQE